MFLKRNTSYNNNYKLFSHHKLTLRFEANNKKMEVGLESDILMLMLVLFGLSHPEYLFTMFAYSMHCRILPGIIGPQHIEGGFLEKRNSDSQPIKSLLLYEPPKLKPLREKHK